MIITALFSTMLAMAFRKRFRGSGVLFYAVMAGLMVPGVLLSLGLASMLRQLGMAPAWWYSALGVHVVWTLPFGFLVMMAVFNRFDARLEEAARVAVGVAEWHGRHVGLSHERALAAVARPLSGRESARHGRRRVDGL